MQICNLKEYSKIYLFGDIHGEFNQLNRVIMSNSSNIKQKMEELEMMKDTSMKKKKMFNQSKTTFNDSVIIIAGDCGFGFNKEEYYNDILSKMNPLLKEINAQLIFVRGNHDDPSYFKGKINMSNIKAVDDYTVILTENENILCIGGAVSLDRSWRVSHQEHINRFSQGNKKILFWKDEMPYLDMDSLSEIIENGLDINFVVTHTAPSFIDINVNSDIKAWEVNDPKLRQDIHDERAICDNIYKFLIENNMTLKGWCFGHFHQDYQSQSEEFIPFLGMADNMSYHNIYECGKVDEEITFPKAKKVNARGLADMLLGNDHNQPRYEPLHYDLHDFHVERLANHPVELGAANNERTLQDAQRRLEELRETYHIAADFTQPILRG